MSEVIFSYPQIIGIAGAARAGKDTLCRALIRELVKRNILGVRKSIAGDTVKRDLHTLLMDKLNINSFTENNETKELIRPLLVEYGKLMRATTQGRYFIEQFQPENDAINILPDIRYVEYPKDEVQWLKDEVNGFLIFVERKGIYDANDTEKVNNKIIRNMADYVLTWDSLSENSLSEKEEIAKIASKILDNIITTYQSDKKQP
jgi:hypothetical protein